MHCCSTEVDRNSKIHLQMHINTCISRCTCFKSHWGICIFWWRCCNLIHTEWHFSLIFTSFVTLCQMTTLQNDQRFAFMFVRNFWGWRMELGIISLTVLHAELQFRSCSCTNLNWSHKQINLNWPVVHNFPSVTSIHPTWTCSVLKKPLQKRFLSWQCIGSPIPAVLQTHVLWHTAPSSFELEPVGICLHQFLFPPAPQELTHLSSVRHGTAWKAAQLQMQQIWDLS